MVRFLYLNIDHSLDPIMYINKEYMWLYLDFVIALNRYINDSSLWKVSSVFLSYTIDVYLVRALVDLKGLVNQIQGSRPHSCVPLYKRKKNFSFMLNFFRDQKEREQALFITPKFYNNFFLFVGLKTFTEFWLVGLFSSNVSTFTCNLQKG